MVGEYGLVNRIRRVLAIAGGMVLCGLIAGCEGFVDPAAGKDPLSPAVKRAAGSIQGQDIRAVVAEISSDAYTGRAPGTAGDLQTQAFLVGRLQALGLQPGAGGNRWRQHFDLIELLSHQPPSWTFTTGNGPLRLRQGDEFIVGTGVQAAQTRLQGAELVFVGYGIQAPEYDWDDYKGVDVRGKILVMLNNDPHTDADLFAGATRLYYGRWTYKYEMAAQLGAAGAVIIHTDYSAGYPWQVVQTSWSGGQFELPNEGEPTLAVRAWVSASAGEKLIQAGTGGRFSLADLTAMADRRDFRPVPLGITTSMVMDVEQRRIRSANVLGLLPGSDPQLSQQVVVYTAHHDHLGEVPGPAGDTTNNISGAGEQAPDRIYNGAMDNASGVASVLAIAKAFARLETAPRRSILFAFVGAEEQGLLGSKYYARHPTFAPGNIVANINMDAGQIAGRTRDISYIGYGRSSLDQIAESAALLQQRRVTGDPAPSAGLFYRSDHFSLAQIGVPSIYFSGGLDLLKGGVARGRAQARDYVSKHYHQPSDELTSAWRFDGLVEDAQFGFFAGVLIAQQAGIPYWYPGDEFAAARKSALDNLAR